MTKERVVTEDFVKHCDLGYAHGQTPRVVEVEVAQKLKDIPEPTYCPACGGPGQKEIVDYQVSTPKLTVVCVNFPGYGCPDCCTKWLDTKACIEFYTIAIELFQAEGEMRKVATLQTQIEISQAVLAQQRAKRATQAT